MDVRKAVSRFFFGKEGAAQREQRAAEREHETNLIEERRKRSSASKATQYVTVIFRDLERADLPSNSRATYVYRWNVHGVQPCKGMFVQTPSSDGLPGSTAVIERIATSADLAQARQAGFSSDQLKVISRVFSDEQVEAAIEQRKKRERIWLNMMRRQAGLEVAGRQRQSVPEGMRPIPPDVQPVTPADAHAFARTWREAIEVGKQHGLTQDELERFQAIRKEWFRVEDEGA